MHRNLYFNADDAGTHELVSGPAVIEQFDMVESDGNTVNYEIKIGPNFSDAYLVDRGSVSANSQRKLLIFGDTFVLNKGQKLFLTIDNSLSIVVGGIPSLLFKGAFPRALNFQGRALAGEGGVQIFGPCFLTGLIVHNSSGVLVEEVDVALVRLPRPGVPGNGAYVRRREDFSINEDIKYLENRENVIIVGWDQFLGIGFEAGSGHLDVLAFGYKLSK
jgi:hypothetical protein